jgi:hypothetical protein
MPVRAETLLAIRKIYVNKYFNSKIVAHTERETMDRRSIDDEKWSIEKTRRDDEKFMEAI